MMAVEHDIETNPKKRMKKKKKNPSCLTKEVRTFKLTKDIYHFALDT